ncbi:hypothetical protein [Paraflavitalea speifideaquila]|uniref:hypothetical protein n=1 Tax=Paraflavitalea speifideaquila TaxID=3076558 RepID=UPI0028F0008E|nr:hypothetical protein [Paraflavitalea speifideiaquila]
MKYFVLAYLLLFTGLAATAQRNCATYEYLQQRLQADPLLAQKMAAIESYQGGDVILNGTVTPAPG